MGRHVDHFQYVFSKKTQISIFIYLCTLFWLFLWKFFEKRDFWGKSMYLFFLQWQKNAKRLFTFAPSLKINQRSYSATPFPPMDSLLNPFEYTVQKKNLKFTLLLLIRLNTAWLVLVIIFIFVWIVYSL